MSACAQAGLWQQAADMLQHVPQQHRAECDVQAVAQAALQGGGHAAVCDLFFKHLQQQWREVQGEALCLFLTSLHAQGHSREEEQLLQHLQSIGAAFPQAAACCMPILLQSAQFERVVDSYFLLKRAALPISPPTFSCVIAACARHPLPFATFAAMLEAARLSLSPLPLPPHDWDNAAAAAAHSASPLEARSFACEAHAAGHRLDAAAATALLLATSARGSGAEVVQLLQLLPLPLPSQCVAAAATALVQQDLWQDALAVVEVEGGCSALSLAAPQPYDLACVERCSKLFKVHGIPTDACFTKAALRCRCMQLLQAGSSDAAAQLLLPALRNSLADVHTCVHVIIALASDAAAPPPACVDSPKPGTSGSSIVQRQQRAHAAAERAAALRLRAIAVFHLARDVFEGRELGQAVDCVVQCLHEQQQPRALLDTLDAYLNLGQKLSDGSYACAVIACEQLQAHERALALLSEMQCRGVHVAAVRAGSRCAMACGQRRLALELHAEAMQAEEEEGGGGRAWGEGSIIPPCVTPPVHPHSPGKLNRHASFFPSSPSPAAR